MLESQFHGRSQQAPAIRGVKCTECIEIDYNVLVTIVGKCL